MNLRAFASLLIALAGASIASAQTSAVAHLTVQSGNGQVACQCVSATLQQFQPISVLATDASGNPVAGATVNWAVTSGQMNLGNASSSQVGDKTGTSVTDANGIASHFIGLIVVNVYTSSAVPYMINTVQATANNQSVNFTETQSLINTQGSSVISASSPTYNNQPLSSFTGNAGSTLSSPIQMQVAGLGLAGNGVPNAVIRLVAAQASPSISCATGAGADPGTVLSDSGGWATCYPVLKGSGTGAFYVDVGGPLPATDYKSALYLNFLGPFTFTSVPGAPKTFTIISGNNQFGVAGQQLSPMVAQLTDVGGNLVAGQNVVWTVTPPGAAALVSTTTVTDNNGQVSSAPILYAAAAAGAQITVAVQGNTSISATFTTGLSNSISAMNKISGDNQTAQTGTNFGQQLVVQVLNGATPVKGYSVQYTFTGVPITLVEGVTVGTDSNGYASVTPKAGNTAGTATVKASVGLLTQTFTLTVTSTPVAPPPNGITIISGNGQSLPVGGQFNPLIVQVNSTAGAVANYPVTFTPSGPVTLSSTAVNTGTNGQASVNATAGSNSGAVSVTASVPGYSVTFNLTVTPPLPPITGASFLNAASRVAGAISPCSLAILSASGITPDGTADYASAPIFGRLPTSVHNLSITFAGTPAPIVSVGQGPSNNPEVTFQVPCEVKPGGNVPVTVSINGSPVSLYLTVQTVSPGIFETANTDTTKRAVAVRDDGSFADLGGQFSNPTRRGEHVRIYATGLGATNPLIGTNSIQNPGADLFKLDALVTGQVVVGLGGYGGVQVVSSRQAPDLIGVYEVEFIMPTDAPLGDNIVISVGVIPDGSPSGTQAVTGQSSKIAIHI